MKIASATINRLLISILFLLPAHSIKAQFLKNILQTVKQTTQNRANSKTEDATNKEIDKIGRGKKKSATTSGGEDSSATNGVLGAFGKAVADNPNDTSMADILSKGLGNLAGGGGVSAADSAAAIKTFYKASGGNGIYYEYSIESTTKENGSVKSTSKIYFTNSGEGRSEMNLAAMMGAKNAKALVNIGRMNEPHYSLTIDNDLKEYSLNVIDTALINNHLQKYSVTKLGNETVNGYNCTHARLKITTGSGLFKSSSNEDVWTSTEVPGYSLVKKATLQQNITPAMMNALNNAGCGGMFVKMTSGDKHYSMTMQLSKAEVQSFPSAMFKIPAGYSEAKNNLMIGSLMQAGRKQ